MNCLDCQKRLEDCWHHPDLPEEVGCHVRQCATCTLYRQRQEALRTALGNLPRPQTPPTLGPKILSALQRETRSASKRFARSTVVWALAASLLVAVTLGFQTLSPTKRAPIASQVLAKHAVTPAGERKADSPVDAIASLSEKLVDESRQNLRILVAAASPVDSFVKTDAGGSTLPSFEVPENLRSVGDSARRAFVFFQTEFPMLEIPSTPREDEGESP